jgi:thymidine phosphorylase
MDVPLGAAIGNAVEIRECVQILRGEGPADASALIVTLATRMVMIGRGLDAAHAEQQVRTAITSGAALDRLRALIARHGGDAAIVDQPERLPHAVHRVPVAADRSGYVGDLDAARLAYAALALGAGRESVGQPIDHAVGIVLDRAVGDPVRAGDAVLHLHYNDRRRLDEALGLARGAVRISDTPPPHQAPVIGWVTEGE